MELDIGRSLIQGAMIPQTASMVSGRSGRRVAAERRQPRNFHGHGLHLLQQGKTVHNGHHQDPERQTFRASCRRGRDRKGTR